MRLLALVLAAMPGSAPAGEDPCPDLPSPPPERGVALGLFASDPEWAYDGLLDEIAATGASHVSLVWVWWQDDLRATRIRPKPGWSATEAQVVDAIQGARARGLHVTVFPIVRLVRPGPGEWRGRIDPDDEDAWWASYDAYILRAGALAAHGGAERLSVGSELLTREGMRSRWGHLIDRIRLRHPHLELMYSANWDHWRPVRFWDLVDVVGLTAYWEVGRGVPAGLPPSARVAALERGWVGPRAELEGLAGAVPRPMVLTEVGYPSLVDGTRFPWDETRRAEVDLEEQRAGYEAFARAFGGRAFLRGAFFWNWFGFGGPEDGDYTPRGKPAARVIRCWFRPRPEGSGGEAAAGSASGNRVGAAILDSESG